jgi:hypothetical protein
MPEYLYVYYGGSGATPTPAEQEKTIEVWMSWFERLGKAVVDVGAPVKAGKTVNRTRTTATGKDSVAGYTVVRANSMGAAVKMARSHPDVARGMRIAVYEITPV